MGNFFVKTKEVETKVKNVKPDTKLATKAKAKKIKSNLILPPKSKHKEQDERSFAEKLESLNLCLKGLDIEETRPEPEQSMVPELEHDYNALLDLIVEQDKRIDLLTRLVGQYREDNNKVLDIQESLLDRLFNIETDLYK